jgi:predicted AlkP superfamily phosphohydrolase/phosphomutase
VSVLVIDVAGACPERLLHDEQLDSLRSLMAGGIYGLLRGVIPPDGSVSQLCLVTGLDPGMLGFYGATELAQDYLPAATPGAAGGKFLWEHFAPGSGTCNLIGLPDVARRARGDAWPRPRASASTISFADSAAPGSESERYVAETAIDPSTLPGLSDDDACELLGLKTHQQFDLLRRLLRRADWSYTHIVVGAVELFERRFERSAGPPGRDTDDRRADFYLRLDEEIGQALECLGANTTVVVVSSFSVVAASSAFRINDWLIDQGLLTLRRPTEIAENDAAPIDWSRTIAWSEGGSCARIHLNVAGRRPLGIVPESEYDNLRDDLRARLAAAPGLREHAAGVTVRKPEAIYRALRGAAPDLIAHASDFRCLFDAAITRSQRVVEFRGTPRLGSCRAPQGFMAMAGDFEAAGELPEVQLLDIAPSVLTLSGREAPPEMPGRVLTAGIARPAGEALGEEDEHLVRERLKGLGYIE